MSRDTVEVRSWTSFTPAVYNKIYDKSVFVIRGVCDTRCQMVLKFKISLRYPLMENTDCLPFPIKLRVYYGKLQFFESQEHGLRSQMRLLD